MDGPLGGIGEVNVVCELPLYDFKGLLEYIFYFFRYD